MTQRFLLRVEAVNLASFVYDTSRLPTVRGGGLLLLRAPKRIEAWLAADERVAKVETLRAGASAGVFAFDAAPEAGEMVRAALEKKLGEDETLRHATFVVDVVVPTGDFQQDLERLVALNRFRQMRSPSVAYPSRASEVPCAVDGIRPGAEQGYLPGEGKRNVSTSVVVRTEHGRAQKQEFYREEAGELLDAEASVLGDAPFARDFHELADDPRQGRLHGKLAVLYMDGNRFGAIQQRLCQSAADAKAFDEQLQSGKRRLLAGLLRSMHERPEGWLFTGPWKSFYRFETLLWGGDELLFVVPAWKGWWLLGEIFAQLAGWSFRGTPLTFGAGLVLCHSKAPIRRIRRLASDLAEEAKEVSRGESLCAYQVLESFDLAPGNFEEFRNQRSAGRDRGQMVVAGANLKALGEAIGALRAVVPRKRLYRLTSAILEGNAKLAAQERQELRAVSPGSSEGWKTLAAASRSAEAGELHLAELWDYVEAASPAPAPAEAEVAHAAL